jgi:hypothetical protein
MTGMIVALGVQPDHRQRRRHRRDVGRRKSTDITDRSTPSAYDKAVTKGICDQLGRTPHSLTFADCTPNRRPTGWSTSVCRIRRCHCLFIGGMVPYLFGAMAMEAVTAFAAPS